MPLYAGTCQTDITPPPGAWMSGYAHRPTGAQGVHDSLHASAIVLDDGSARLVIISSDLISFPSDMATRIRTDIAERLDTPISAVMLHSTHTHGGPYLGTFRCMGERFPEYELILILKLVGIAVQAAGSMRPARLSYGEASVQIGVNRRSRDRSGSVVIGQNYSGPVSPIVQTLSISGVDGRLFALLFCHACHPTTIGGENLQFTAEWPGVAVERLKNRFKQDGHANGVEPNALPVALQGCCADINPYLRGSWEAIESNGELVAEAVNTARWGGHGQIGGPLKHSEVTLSLPTLAPISEALARNAVWEWEHKLADDREAGASPGKLLYDQGMLDWAQDQLVRNHSEPHGGHVDFSIQHLDLGGVSILGFPAEMFVSYQLDFSRQSHHPAFSLGYTNGCINYMPAAADFPAGGYEVAEAYKYYGCPMFTAACEPAVREAVYRLLAISDPDFSPYPAACE